ncbi:hypothetical protein B0H10DRAFT_2322758 [Mycena sp. CBHHK59/15]|nr:hypothetical protein B0H10DRAFT_2322758 [Mycena sp. CBHHK59/15]
MRRRTRKLDITIESQPAYACELSARKEMKWEHLVPPIKSRFCTYGDRDERDDKKFLKRIVATPIPRKGGRKGLEAWRGQSGAPVGEKKAEGAKRGGQQQGQQMEAASLSVSAPMAVPGAGDFGTDGEAYTSWQTQAQECFQRQQQQQYCHYQQQLALQSNQALGQSQPLFGQQQAQFPGQGQGQVQVTGPGKFYITWALQFS